MLYFWIKISLGFTNKALSSRVLALYFHSYHILMFRFSILVKHQAVTRRYSFQQSLFLFPFKIYIWNFIGKRDLVLLVSFVILSDSWGDFMILSMCMHISCYASLHFSDRSACQSSSLVEFLLLLYTQNTTCIYMVPLPLQDKEA